MNVIFYFSSSNFWSIYLQQHWNQACFLMNKKILISFWTMKHSKSDFSLLIFKLKNMILHIHNVYLSFLKFLQNINKNFLIYSLQQLLSKSDEYLLVRNFNIHYLIWEKIKCMKQHNMMNNLIQITSETDLILLIFTDTIIKKFKNQISILNLIFATAEIICRLMNYAMNWIIKNKSDHYLIFTVLCFEIIMQSQQQKWQWKNMNMKKIIIKTQHFHILIHFIISEVIEQYTDYLMKFIKQLIRNTMLLVKSAADYFYSWWTLKINKAVCRARKTWRHENHDEKIMKVNKYKKKIICRVKIL